MKTCRLFVIPTLAAMLFCSCGTRPSERKGGDTTLNNYDQKAGIDTSATTHFTGNSGTVDNSGSGGTGIVKDSSHVKKDSVKH